MSLKGRWTVMTAVALVAVAAAGSVSLGQAGREQGQAGQLGAEALLQAKWDCVKNNSGKNLRVILASHLSTGTYTFLGKGQKIEFKIISDDTKNMGIIAFEYNTNNVVRAGSFKTFPQNYPPTSCYSITQQTAALEKGERVKSEEHEEENRGAEIY